MRVVESEVVGGFDYAHITRRAADEYRRAADIEPKNTEYRRLLADVLREKGDTDAAEEAYAEVCKLGPFPSECYDSTGLEWLGWKSPQPAVNSFTAAINNAGRGDTKVALYYAERAAAYLEFKSPETALSYYRELALGDALQAVGLAEQNAGLNEQNAVCQSMLGDVYTAKDDYGKAQEAYQSAADLMPENYEYHFKLARALYNKATNSGLDSTRAEDLKSAREHFRRASSITGDADKKKECADGIKKINSELDEEGETEFVTGGP